MPKYFTNQHKHIYCSHGRFIISIFPYDYCYFLKDSTFNKTEKYTCQTNNPLVKRLHVVYFMFSRWLSRANQGSPMVIQADQGSVLQKNLIWLSQVQSRNIRKQTYRNKGQAKADGREQKLVSNTGDQAE